MNNADSHQNNAPPAIPKLAASVLLVRAGHSGGIEVFVQRRASTMAFAPGVTVFPGGGLDPSDGGDLALTAARELFEEAGVLLVNETITADRHPHLAAARAEITAHRMGFSTFLADAGLTLRTDLVPIARWITPELRTRRYDTTFLLATLPAGQIADGETSEAVSADWITPAAALDSWVAGEHELMPPTWSMFHLLEGVSDIDDAVPWARRHADLHPVLPGARETEEQRALSFADAERYFSRTR